MFRHNFCAFTLSVTSPLAFAFTVSEQDEFISHMGNHEIEKFLISKPDSDLHSVKGKGKIRTLELTSTLMKDGLSNAPQNVFCFSIPELFTCDATEVMRRSGHYTYIPKMAKFGFLSALLDANGVKKSAPTRPRQTYSISLLDHAEVIHPLGGIPISEHYNFDEMAVAYMMLAPKFKRIISFEVSDLRTKGKTVCSSSFIKYAEEDGPIEYLAVPIYAGAESIVVRIPPVSNFAELLTRYNMAPEFLELHNDATYHGDVSGLKIYSVPNFSNNVIFHRNLSDPCSDTHCQVSICAPSAAGLTLTSDDLVNLDFSSVGGPRTLHSQNDFTDLRVNHVDEVQPRAAASYKLPPKEQRTLYSRDDTLSLSPVNEYLVSSFVGLDISEWMEFGQKIDIIARVKDERLAGVLMQAAVQDMSN